MNFEQNFNDDCLQYCENLTFKNMRFRIHVLNKYPKLDFFYMKCIMTSEVKIIINSLLCVIFYGTYKVCDEI